MGLDRSDYIMYGYRLPSTIKNAEGEKIDWFSDRFLPLIEGHQGEEFRIIIGEGTSDIFFGLRLYSATDRNGWDFQHLDFKNLDAEKVKRKYREVFGLVEDVSIAEPYLFIFSNWW